jgi:hypothetical protein
VLFYGVRQVSPAKVALLLGILLHAGPAFPDVLEIRKITIKDPDGVKVWGSADEETRVAPDGKHTRETIYKNARGETVQRDVTTFDPSTLEVASYLFENSASSELVSVEAKDNKVSIRTREPGQNQVKSIDTEWKRGAAFGKLLDRWIQKNEARLAKGEYVPVELYIPSKADAYGFRLRHDKEASRGSSEDIYVMEARNWFIRLFIPRVEFRFDKTPQRRLRGIVGPYPLLNEEKNQGMQVLFVIE